MALLLRWVGEDDLDRVAQTRMRCYTTAERELPVYQERIRSDRRAHPGDFLLAEEGGLAVGTAPIAGGALLTMAAGKFKAPVPDFRGLIKQDQELLQRIPAEQTARRAELQRTIDVRIDDLISANDRTRELRAEAGAYQGDWRDVVVFLCVVLFGVIWWGLPHSRSAWLPTFIVLILLAVLTAAYAMRGLIRSLSKTVRPHHRQR